MFPAFAELKSKPQFCKPCASTGTHHRIGFNFTCHFMVAFFTFGAWLPVWIFFGIVEVCRRWRCARCAPIAAQPNVSVPEGESWPSPVVAPMPIGGPLDRGAQGARVRVG